MRKKTETWLNNLSLRKKLWGLYFFCVLLPLIVTDGVILLSLWHSEQVTRQHSMEEQASAVQYSISNFVEYSSVIARSMYMNNYLQDFLTTSYDGPADYVASYQQFMRNSLFAGSSGLENATATIYADNDTIVNGGGVYRLSEAADTPWYRQFIQRDTDTMLLFFYDDQDVPYVRAERKVLFLRKLNRILSDSMEKLLAIEIDYSSLERNIRNMNYEFPVYICRGEELMFSNAGANILGEPFEEFTLEDQVGFEQDFTLYGEKLRICVLRPDRGVLQVLKNNLPLILLLLLINIVLPQMLMSLISCSITERLQNLSRVFEKVDGDVLMQIPEASGKDEIGILMESYNHMADRMNGLIQTVYKDRLREQESDIARQNAELLALHSQINPHFLFNALESIRMHSILKEEFETAGMVEKLAVMERQNVDWTSDVSTISREMEFVEAYLELQKYRFGERLSYQLEVRKECRDVLIPKLTITTFVENACVHGIESKATPGWIFVRVYQEREDLCIEVEDTGGGMTDEELETIRFRMENASIAMLKEKGRVGIVNACLRIRMFTEDTARFTVDSEKGIGTTMLIRIPLDKVKREV